jgi:uncharacterized repeat protein (TIGR02543 family)
MIINSLVVKKGSAPDPGPGEGDYLVRFIDYDGTILKQQRVNSGNAATAPTVPTHAGLTFQEWNNAFSAVTGDIDVGATYITSDGKTHAKVRLTVPSGLSLTLFLNKSNADEMTVDWGHDSAVSTFTNSGNFNTGAHVFPDYGDYEITIWMSSGTGTYGFGNGTEATTFVGGNTQAQRNTLLELYAGERVVALSIHAFRSCYSLTSLTLPAGMTGSIGANAFRSCYSLTSLTLPAGMTGSIGADAFYNCYSLVSLILPAGMTGSIGANAFQYCYSLVSLILPAGITGSIESSAFQSCISLASLTLPAGMTGSIGATAFQNCFSLSLLTLPAGMTGSIGDNAFQYCISLALTLPAGMTGSIGTSVFHSCHSLSSLTLPAGITGNINNSAFQNCYSLTSLTLPAGITGSIGTSAFQSCFSILEYIFSLTSPQTLSNTNAFASINTACKIFVPDASVLAYRAATNWVTYANYIQPISNRSGSAVILFNSNGGTAVAPLVGTKGDTATEPTSPTKADVTFDGWYKEAALTNAWDWDNDVYPSTNLTLFAKWV